MPEISSTAVKASCTAKICSARAIAFSSCSPIRARNGVRADCQTMDKLRAIRRVSRPIDFRWSCAGVARSIGSISLTVAS